MPTIHLIQPGGERQTLDVKGGQSLMRAATDLGVTGIVADCGGNMNCATCHVYVDPAWAPRLTPASDDEQAMLEMTASEARATSRLSCQIGLSDALDGLVVEIPPTQY